MKKLAIVTTHPIQYYAPIFQLLHQRGNLHLKVFYTWGKDSLKKYDPGFGKTVEWDIPLLDGYEYEFLENTSTDPGTHHFRGIINPGIIKKLTHWAPDAILFFGWNYQSHLRAIRHFAGKTPIWFRGDSTLLNEGSGFRRYLRRFFLTWLYRKISLAFYVGQNNKAYYLAHGLKEDQLVFAPHAIDNERFFDTPQRGYEEKAKQWRKELGITPDEICILFAGKLEPVKNPFLLLRAVKSINLKTQKPIKLIFVGNGLLEHKLKVVAENDPNILFLDFKNQSTMPIVYRLGDIFCLPSVQETWGLAVNEAMACGRPIIVSDKTGCFTDLAKGKPYARVFRSEDIGSLTEILQSFSVEVKANEELGLIAKTNITRWNFLNIVKAFEGSL